MTRGITTSPGTSEASRDADTQAEHDADAPVAAAAEPAGSPQPAQSSVPRSPYATVHHKNMQNYRYRPGTRITNTVSTARGVTSPQRGDFGKPNDYEPDKIPEQYYDLLHSTVSVDIGTVVGGNPETQYRSGWVLVFHTTKLEDNGERVSAFSGDHTGWIKVKQLPDKKIAYLASYQDKVRAELKRGPGSGHPAKARGDRRKLAIQNHEMLWNPRAPGYFRFIVKGGDGETSLGNYTLNPPQYGNIVVGTWNPPGSGAGDARFSGSGGIRAFLPLDKRFRLTETSPMTITDDSGQATAIWHYVTARLNGEQIYFWLLRSWEVPRRTTSGGKARGNNF